MDASKIEPELVTGRPWVIPDIYFLIVIIKLWRMKLQGVSRGKLVITNYSYYFYSVV